MCVHDLKHPTESIINQLNNLRSDLRKLLKEVKKQSKELAASQTQLDIIKSKTKITVNE